jgi:hypothetical protein
MCCSTYIDLCMLNLCIPGMKPTWSWCMLYLMCCRIPFAGILFEIFVFKMHDKAFFVAQYGPLQGKFLVLMKRISILQVLNEMFYKCLSPFALCNLNLIFCWLIVWMISSLMRMGYCSLPLLLYWNLSVPLVLVVLI